MIIDWQPGFCGGQISNQMFIFVDFLTLKKISLKNVYLLSIDLFLHLVEQCSRIVQKYLKHFKQILKILVKILIMKYFKK